MGRTLKDSFVNLIEYLTYRQEKDREFCALCPFIQLFNINFILRNISFFIFGVEISKTKQIVVALVATTLKALLAVAKTNGRLSGREFYAGNVYYLFFNIFIHISPYWHIKKVRNRSHAPKKHKPLLLRNKPLTNRRIIHIHKDGTCTFYQIQIFADAKRQSTPTKKYS